MSDYTTNAGVCEPLAARKEQTLISKIKHSLAEQIFGIGRYTYSPEGQLYFVHGNTRIKVTEHFPQKGKPVGDLVQDVILYSARQNDVWNSSSAS